MTGDLRTQRLRSEQCSVPCCHRHMALGQNVWELLRQTCLPARVGEHLVDVGCTHTSPQLQAARAVDETSLLEPGRAGLGLAGSVHGWHGAVHTDLIPCKLASKARCRDKWCSRAGNACHCRADWHKTGMRKGPRKLTVLQDRVGVGKHYGHRVRDGQEGGPYCPIYAQQLQHTEAGQQQQQAWGTREAKGIIILPGLPAQHIS